MIDAMIDDFEVIPKPADVYVWPNGLYELSYTCHKIKLETHDGLTELAADH
jgi:hypothetical protein